MQINQGVINVLKGDLENYREELYGIKNGLSAIKDYCDRLNEYIDNITSCMIENDDEIQQALENPEAFLEDESSADEAQKLEPETIEEEELVHEPLSRLEDDQD